MEKYFSVSVSIVVLVLSFCLTVRAACLQNESNGLESSLGSTEEVNCCIGYQQVTGERQCEVCSNWTYGKSCQQNCRCVRENTRACDHVTGQCLCQPYWNGTTCSNPLELKLEKTCQAWTFGTNCSQSCSCNKTNAASCNALDGTCTCNPGYTDSQCNSVCQAWTFGTKCSQSCTCNKTNSVSCNAVDGTCICYPGYTDSQCNSACQSGKFGQACSQTCRCDTNNTLACAHVSGACSCSTGWTGTYCNETCGSGTYGDKCASNCSCPANAQPVCNHITGACTCQPGYSGDTCQKDAVSTTSSSPLSVVLTVLDDPIYASIITLVITLLVVALILCIMWKVCKCTCSEVKHRRERLKGPRQLVTTPVVRDANNDAIAAMAKITSRSIRVKEDSNGGTQPSVVYGASPDVTGRPPSPTQGGVYYYGVVAAPPTPSPLPSANATVPPWSLPKTSKPVPEKDVYYNDASSVPPSVSTFARNTAQGSTPDVRTAAVLWNDNVEYYNDTFPTSGMNATTSQPNVAIEDKKDAFDGVISALLKKPDFKMRRGQSNLYKNYVSQSQPNISTLDLKPALKTTNKPIQFGKTHSHSDTNVTHNPDDDADNVYMNTFAGSRARTGHPRAPIPVAPPVVTLSTEPVAPSVGTTQYVPMTSPFQKVQHHSVAPPVNTTPYVPMTPPVGTIPQHPLAPPVGTIPQHPVAPPVNTTPYVPMTPPVGTIPQHPLAPPVGTIPQHPVAPPVDSMPHYALPPPVGTIPHHPMAPPVDSIPHNPLAPPVGTIPQHPNAFQEDNITKASEFAGDLTTFHIYGNADVNTSLPNQPSQDIYENA